MITVVLLKIDGGVIMRGETKKVVCSSIGYWFRAAFENLAAFGFGTPRNKFGELKVVKLVGCKGNQNR